MLTGTCIILGLKITCGVQVTLRDGASGSPAADSVNNDRQSMFVRVRAYCAKLFHVTRALPVPSHTGANPAAEAADSHHSGRLDQQARGATQHAAVQPEAEQAFMADQSNGLAMGPGAHTSTPADVLTCLTVQMTPQAMTKSRMSASAPVKEPTSHLCVTAQCFCLGQHTHAPTCTNLA